MADIQRSSGSVVSAALCAAPGHKRYSPVESTDPVQFTEQIRDWSFVFTQLKPGKLTADGAMLELDGVSIGSVDISHTMLHQGYAPPTISRGNMLATKPQRASQSRRHNLPWLQRFSAPRSLI